MGQHMCMNKVSSFILALGVCTALSACQTSQSVQEQALRTSSVDSAIQRSANYARKPTKSPAYLERAYKKNPDSEQAAVDYAVALRENGKLALANTVLEPFARENDASSLVTSEYAAVQLADGDYEAAEKYAQKAVITDETNFKAFHRLGIALDAQGMHEEAERAYRKGLELWQGDPTTIMNNLALNLASQGYLDESIEILVKAQDVAPRRKEIERNLRIVTALKQADGVPVPKPHKKPTPPVKATKSEEKPEVKPEAEPKPEKESSLQRDDAVKLTQTPEEDITTIEVKPEPAQDTAQAVIETPEELEAVEASLKLGDITAEVPHGDPVIIVPVEQNEIITDPENIARNTHTAD